VVWNVGCDSGKEAVWWGAFVRDVVNPVCTIAPRTATLRYDAMDGYKAADCNVLFIGISVLEAVEGPITQVLNHWGWAESAGVSPEGGGTVLTFAVEVLGTEKRYELQAADDEECGRSAGR
jgi:hypothetical protein